MAWNLIIVVSIFSRQVIYHISTVSCESLPLEWEEMVTNAQFPLPPGSEVFLTCKPGHTLTGDSTVTCLKGTDFSFNTAPSCSLGL